MKQLFAFVASAVMASVLAAAPQAPFDGGAAGVWHKLRKLKSTASVMHTTAHPDDEHGGVLALLSRRDGARVSLLTLTRGESGDNAIGPELFDALGLIRTEELLAADRFYSVDHQYFGTVVDYGFSKRLDETLEKWGRQHVLRDMVGAIRTDRPLVLIARFQGNERDGHGNHSAAGLITREAFRAAGDAAAFPEQIAAGLRPWQPLKLYMGGVRQSEDWTLRVDAGQFDGVLGQTYHAIARQGLSYQRSQNAGRVSAEPGPAFSYYQRLESLVPAPAREESFFDGIDTTISGIYKALRKDPLPQAASGLVAIEREVAAAEQAFTIANPAAIVTPLARALSAIRRAAQQAADDDVVFALRVKERQAVDAIDAALGLRLTAVAQPPGAPPPSGPFGSGVATMEPVVPGQAFEVRATLANPSTYVLENVRIDLEGQPGPAAWPIRGDGGAATANRNESIVRTIGVRAPDDAPVTRPHFKRSSIQEARYTISETSSAYRPSSGGALRAIFRFEVEGVPLEIRRPVTRFEANLPYGFDSRELAVVPAIAVTLSPAHAIAPVHASPATIQIEVDVLNNRDTGSTGTVALKAPADWTVSPPTHAFDLTRPGERARYAFAVTMPRLEAREYRVEAVALSGGREYREGYATIRHRDLETRYLYRDAMATVRGVDVRIASGLRVGYVMGIGDDVPAAVAQLGVAVTLLDRQKLAAESLQAYDAIITGTRAYAVREDLKTYNQRLLEYVRRGGHLIVLYNTQELVPKLHAPYPGDLPANAEEVSEEDSPVEILAPEARVLNAPNRITKADFEGWVEQRGSKFWSAWDPQYSPIVATWDRGQKPQRGGWLHARYGDGHYTYFAYSLHRQLPYGVPGAFRILANLLSLRRDGADR
jgi:LmbE family N-acetylglucosaminyl deacetylase